MSTSHLKSICGEPRQGKISIVCLSGKYLKLHSSMALGKMMGDIRNGQKLLTVSVVQVILNLSSGRLRNYLIWSLQ
ncbi:MAG: hypothetical protein RBG13Loki_3698 [Promethearchaeota archaeon CR_4]|nr:MAG: hypothetical protein RBG13Loki_3698 [Candidatus Lokiarchaeota archaeon CR_4]